MIPRERYARLVKNGRPFIRPLEETDMGFLWVAYQKGGFQLPKDLTQEQFVSYMSEVASKYAKLFVVDDTNSSFKSGKGQIGLIKILSDGWKVCPEFDFFPWATKRNILRSCVVFFKKVKYSNDVGACVVKTTEPYVKSYHHLKKYDVLVYRGKIPGGNPSGDEYIFSIKGSRKT